MEEEFHSARSGMEKKRSGDTIRPDHHLSEYYSFIKLNKPETAKNIFVYLNGDNYFAGRKIVVNRRYVPDFTGFLDEVTLGLRAPFGAVRNIYTPNSGHRINDLDQLQTGMQVVAAGTEKFRKLDYTEIGLKKRQRKKKRNYLDIQIPHKMNVSARWRKYLKDPCLIYVYGNGDMNGPAVRLLLIPRTLKSWDMVLEEITGKISLRTGKAVRKLYDMDYRLLSDPSELENGQYYVAVGTEKLKKYRYGDIHKAQSSRKAFHHLPPIKKASKEPQQGSHEDGDKTYTKMYAQKKAKQSETIVIPATAATNYQPIKMKKRNDPFPSPLALSRKKEAESVILAKPVKVKRAQQPAKPVEVTNPVASAHEIDGVFRSSYRQIRADQVEESDDVKVYLPIDQVPAEIVEEEIRSENRSAMDKSSEQQNKSKSADSKKRLTARGDASRSKSGTKSHRSRNGSTREDVTESLASEVEPGRNQVASAVDEQSNSISKSPMPELLQSSKEKSLRENSGKSAFSGKSKLDPISRRSADSQSFKSNHVTPEPPKSPLNKSIKMDDPPSNLTGSLTIPVDHKQSEPFIFDDLEKVKDSDEKAHVDDNSAQVISETSPGAFFEEPTGKFLSRQESKENNTWLSHESQHIPKDSDKEDAIQSQEKSIPEQASDQQFEISQEILDPHQKSDHHLQDAQENERVSTGGKSLSKHEEAKSNANISEDGEKTRPQSQAKASIISAHELVEETKQADEIENEQEPTFESIQTGKGEEIAAKNVRNIFEVDEPKETIETGEVFSSPNDNDFDAFFENSSNQEKKNDKTFSSDAHNYQVPNPSGWRSPEILDSQDEIQEQTFHFDRNSAFEPHGNDVVFPAEFEENKRNKKSASSSLKSLNNSDSGLPEKDNINRTNSNSRPLSETQDKSNVSDETLNSTNQQASSDTVTRPE